MKLASLVALLATCLISPCASAEALPGYTCGPPPFQGRELQASIGQRIKVRGFLRASGSGWKIELTDRYSVAFPRVGAEQVYVTGLSWLPVLSPTARLARFRDGYVTVTGPLGQIGKGDQVAITLEKIQRARGAPRT